MAIAHTAACIAMRRPLSGHFTPGKQLMGRSFRPSLHPQTNFSSWTSKPASVTHLRKSSTSPVAQDSHVTKVTSQELDKILDGVRDCPIVVDFYATWCGPCILLSQELEKLAAEYGGAVKFLKVDTDEEHELASELKIQGLPTLVFVSKDAEKNAVRTEGLLSPDVIRNIIETEL